MRRKKLIKKIAIPVSIVSLVSLIVILLQFPIRNANFESHQNEFKTYMNKFTSQNKEYLKELSGKIQSVPVDQKFINELQSEYFLEHQQAGSSKKYLWMADMEEKFLFGVPEGSFEKMNESYDTYLDVIKSDNFYRNRNDFLSTLIHKSEQIDYSQFDRKERPRRYAYRSNWRFYDDESWRYIQSTASTFSTPVYDDQGKLIGELFMKVDDANKDKYYSQSMLENTDVYSVLIIIFGLLLGFSLAFLWFLLPTWVYADAQDRDVKNPGIWAFLTLISLFFALTIYLITRPSTTKSFHCPHCEGELNGTKAYCPHCGYDLANTFCQQCQYPIKPDWQFCPNCRAETRADKPLPVNNIVEVNESNINSLNDE